MCNLKNGGGAIQTVRRMYLASPLTILATTAATSGTLFVLLHHAQTPLTNPPYNLGSYIKDIRPSISESVIRSLAHRKLEIHRKFPKTESLKDCMERTIPYFRSVILPNSIDKGKNVLIASSENAIRGLLMHLCEIPTERIHEVEIPTGLPMVYDVDR